MNYKEKLLTSTTNVSILQSKRSLTEVHNVYLP
jgi:hypothetical protein